AEKAEKFIFMEYFIIAEGRMWDTILEILKEKAAAGVDVRLLYDDVGCLRLLPFQYYETIRGFGIKCEAFNPFVPFVSTVMNNRDHRKILVIDGETGFTGGINLADEYINEKERFGYWKDTGIMLKGDAVWNLTVMFLQLWNALRPTDTDFDCFRPRARYETDGYVQPYGDSPLDFENVGENVYLNIINSAKDYVYIFTPYLISDSEMISALCLAAKRGVDVRIVTPHIPDKKFAFMLTQSYYEQLMDGGVKIFEFEPGFIHAKCFVSDDIVATVGTINLDYRSLYLHFECGVYLYRTSSVMDVKQDAIDTIARSIPVTRDMLKPVLQKVVLQAFLKLFAPLF
ncbi:MAG: cardiolipin synthase, partial [Lachnospiraceae bacterium]|nr:cardiolipin synthase [Lachnospiraceae bacterium]